MLPCNAVAVWKEAPPGEGCAGEEAGFPSDGWPEKVETEVSSLTLEQGSRKHSERDKDREGCRSWTQRGGV